ncbi:MAG: branched-chain amino acid ABC transporter permease [Tissierellia bacterium]|nr:branched-chain amino acid ABC transporter permease [Tissierellia bacterium]
MREFFLQIINGLQIGSIYALISLGYTMVYGTAKLINFAHGDIIMVGAYTALYSIPIVTALGVPLWMSVMAAVLICVIFGVSIEKLAYAPLRNSPRISNLITAIGVSLFLQNSAMKFIGASSLPFPRIFSSQPVSIMGLNFNVSILITIFVTLILTIILQLFITKSKFGKAITATSEDYVASKLVGINVDSVITMTFAIGSALAGIGSVLYVGAYPQVGPLMGAMPGIKAFIAAVLGGIGSIPGAVLGGLILGIVEALTKAYISSQLADAFVFLILILVLLVMPNGLLGKDIKEKV